MKLISTAIAAVVAFGISLLIHLVTPLDPALSVVAYIFLWTILYDGRAIAQQATLFERGQPNAFAIMVNDEPMEFAPREQQVPYPPATPEAFMDEEEIQDLHQQAKRNRPTSPSTPAP